ncbi:YDG domain-containing protein, partial [Candidatus Symbiothrix dinenymphae]|uniref:YDG domain-containing protein n=5 Tax=Candidatus Symbiothrix dinenymphae TaxID=467085 RepID=UPI001872879D
AAITPKPVTLTGFSVDSRTYDGTTNATFSGTGNVVGIVEDVGDVVTVEKGTAAFADKNAGPDKPVIFDGFALAGAHKDNYELAAQPVATATITPLPVVVTPNDNLSKTYNTADPPLTYTYSPDLLDEEDHFSGVLSRTSNEKPGTYPINQGSLTAGGNYAISIANKVFTIIPKSITASTVTVASIAAQKYTGKEIKPLPNVVDGGRPLTINTDYTLSYSNNTNEGTATVTINGKGNYKDSRTVEFEITTNTGGNTGGSGGNTGGTGGTGGNTGGAGGNTGGNTNGHAIAVSNADSIGTGYYLAHCEALESVVTVTTKTSSTVLHEGVKGNRFTVDISRGGRYVVKYSIVIARDTANYSLTIESRAAFEDVVSIRYNNLLLVKANTGYGIVGCEWYKADSNGKWEKLSSELSYSAGNKRTDILDATAEYKARLITASGDTVET